MTFHGRVILLVAFVAVGWGGAPAGTHAGAPREAQAQLAVHALALPGAPPPGASSWTTSPTIATHHRVWVPAGNTGSVDVVEATSEKITQLDGFPTAEVERAGTKRTVGPSSATVGEGVVYVGNRADSNVCAVDASALKKGACLKLESSPDGLAYVAATKELWVTTPRDSSITILDASKAGALTPKAKVTVEGAPEGFAVDDGRGVFYTNLEDKDRTLAIDVRTRVGHEDLAAEVRRGGAPGPRDRHRSANFLMVACTDGVQRARRRARRPAPLQHRHRRRGRQHRLRGVAARAVRRCRTRRQAHGRATRRAGQAGDRRDRLDREWCAQPRGNRRRSCLPDGRAPRGSCSSSRPPLESDARVVSRGQGRSGPRRQCEPAGRGMVVR